MNNIYYKVADRPLEQIEAFKNKDDIIEGLEIRQSKIHGKGFFAIKSFKKGEVVLKWDLSQIITEDEINDENKDYIIPFEGHKGKFVLMNGIMGYINHSCNPNTYYRDCSDVALRDIEIGEEITCTDIQGMLGKECNCGSKNCKGKID